MTTIHLEKPLTNLQLELLRLFSHNLSEDRLINLKQIISDYLLDVARDEADKAWEKKGYGKPDADKWLQKEEA